MSSIGQAVGNIARIDTDGNFTDFAIPPDGIGSDQVGPSAYVPISIVTGANGDVYFDLSDDVTDNKLIQVAPDGTMSFFALPDGSQRSALVVATDGAIWFCGSEGTGLPDYLGRFTPDGEVQQFVFPIQQGYEPPGPLRPDVQPGFSSLAPGANGSVWFANEFGGLVGNITTQGTITEYQTGLADTFGISQTSITMAQDGSLWISDNNLENLDVQGARRRRSRPWQTLAAGRWRRHPMAMSISMQAGSALPSWFQPRLRRQRRRRSTLFRPMWFFPPRLPASEYPARDSTTIKYVGGYSDPKFLGEDGA